MTILHNLVTIAVVESLQAEINELRAKSFMDEAILAGDSVLIESLRAELGERDAEMREYGQQCREAALEEAANVCDIHAKGWEETPGRNPQAGFISASNCGVAIRSLK